MIWTQVVVFTYNNDNRYSTSVKESANCKKKYQDSNGFYLALVCVGFMAYKSL